MNYFDEEINIISVLPKLSLREINFVNPTWNAMLFL